MSYGPGDDEDMDNYGTPEPEPERHRYRVTFSAVVETAGDLTSIEGVDFRPQDEAQVRAAIRRLCPLSSDVYGLMVMKVEPQ